MMHTEGNDQAGAAESEAVAWSGAVVAGEEGPGGEGEATEQGDGGADQAWGAGAKPDGDAVVPRGHGDE